jgi:hypothetical protein
MAAGEALFKPFRALGYITDDVPFAVQRRGKEAYVTVSVGQTWQASGLGFNLRACEVVQCATPAVLAVSSDKPGHV